DVVVGIHIADLGLLFPKDDPLDREAYRRCATVYLPNTTVLMLPSVLSTDRASLVSGQVRPAFSIEAKFDRDDALLDFEIVPTRIQVTERLTYQAADQAIAAGDPD